MVISVLIGALGTTTKGFIRETGELGNKRTCGDHPNYSIAMIALNTEKNPGDLKRFAVTQTLVRNHRLTLV